MGAVGRKRVVMMSSDGAGEPAMVVRKENGFDDSSFDDSQTLWPMYCRGLLDCTVVASWSDVVYPAPATKSEGREDAFFLLVRRDDRIEVACCEVYEQRSRQRQECLPLPVRSDCC